MRCPGPRQMQGHGQCTVQYGPDLQALARERKRGLTTGLLVDTILNFLPCFWVAGPCPIITRARIGLLRHELERYEVGGITVYSTE